MFVVRRIISIFVLASLPFATNASFAYTFPFDPGAPSTLRTPPTGTGFGTAAKNQMFLTDIFEGYNIAGGSYTTPDTPWVNVNDQDVIVSDIPFVEGEVEWNSILNTWVDNGVRYFTGNGVPNHPTGLFPISPDQPAYPWYAELPDPGGQCK